MAIDKNTLVLLHLDDNLTDECGHTFTAKNIGYTNAKFGQGALVKGHDSQIICRNPGFNLGGADFTVDFWCYLKGSSQYSTLYSIVWGDGSKIDCYNCISEIQQINNTHGKYFVRTNYESTSYGPSFQISESQVHHVAAVYQHNKKLTTVFVDGKSVQTFLKECPVREVSGISLFRDFHEAGDAFTESGTWIDEFRISDCARWTANFTPQKVPYGSEGGQ